MQGILEFISDTFDINVLALFIISSIILIFFDSQDYKKQGKKREYKFSKFFGYLYMGLGFALYIAAKLIRV